MHFDHRDHAVGFYLRSRGLRGQFSLITIRDPQLAIRIVGSTQERGEDRSSGMFIVLRCISAMRIRCRIYLALIDSRREATRIVTTAGELLMQLYPD